MSVEEIHNSIPDAAPAAETVTQSAPESVTQPASVDTPRTTRQKAPMVDEADVQLQEQGIVQEEVSNTSDETSQTQEDSPVEIPDDQVDAAREAGFTDEQIVSFAESNPDVLKNLAAKFKAPTGEPQTEVQQTQAEPQAQPQQAYSAQDTVILKAIEGVKLDPEKYEPELIGAIDALKQAAMLAINENVQHRQTRQKELNATQKQMFDGLVDAITTELPQVGTSAKLASTNVQVRGEIWNMARAIQTGNPALSDKDAFGEAISWYKGKHGGKATEKAIVEQLNKRSTKLMYRPKNRNINQRTPVTEEQASLEAIKEVKDKYKA